MKKIITLSILATLIMVYGCSHRIADCTLMSTKKIQCQNVDLTKLEQRRDVVGKDIRLLGIGSNIKDAADKALEQANGNLLINPVVYYEEIPLLSGGYVVKGTVVKVPSQNESDMTDSAK